MGLLDALRVGLSGLGAAQAGLEAAQNNVANVNTPGYARLRPNLEEVVLSTNPLLHIPGGVRVSGFTSMRSELLEARVALSEAGLAGADTALRYLGRIEEAVAPGGVSAVGEALDAFSSSLTRLAARPEDPTLRASVLDAADKLASTVRGIASSLTTLAAEGQRELGLRAARVNELSAGIAEVNRQLAGAGDSPGAAALANRRTALVNELAREVDVRTYTDGQGRLSVTLADGTALVTAGSSYQLSVDPAAGGAVSVGERDVTAALTGGAMGGILAARDAALVPTLARLDGIASSIAAAFNPQHQAGFDLAGQPGQDLFVVGAGTTPGAAAAGLTLAISDPGLLAAAAQAAPGDGANAGLLAAAGSALTGEIATLSYRAGADARRAEDGRASNAALRDQAVRAREELSGVSLDEEAVDMVRYQRAYQASSRFLQTVNDLLVELINTVGR